MGKFFSKKWVRKSLIIIAGSLFLIILSWYFLGDSLVMLLLKQGANDEFCHESCMYGRLAMENSLIFLANHRSWVKNKIVKTIINQKEDGNFRALLVDIYRKIIGDNVSFPQEILALLDNPKTPSMVKAGVIEQFSNLQPTKEIIEQSKNIAADDNEGIDARRAAIRKIGKDNSLDSALFLLNLAKNSNNGEIQFFSLIETEGILKDQLLTQSFIDILQSILADKDIHSSIKNFVLDIFAFSKNKDFAKNFILGVYSDSKNYDKFLRYEAAMLLDYLITDKWDLKRPAIYPRPEISDKEQDEYLKNIPY